MPTRKLLAPLVAGALALVTAACDYGPATCAAAACDGAVEMCVLYGSDTFEPDSASCQPLPVGCESDRSCDCLDQTLTEDDGLRFCFDYSCAMSGGVVEVICPGG
jgi:hypothetical protein